jgi:hypothetical protein
MAGSVLMAIPASAQVDMKLGGGIGVVSSVADFNGSTQQYYEGAAYGFNSGQDVFMRAKIGLSGMDIAGEIDFSALQNSGNSEPGQGAVDISQKILSFKLGPEFHFSLPALPVTPYAGANVAVHRFSGEATFQGVSKVPSATYSVEAATRLGIGLSVGAEVSVGPFLFLDFRTSYNFMNVSGREWKDVNPGTNQRIDSYLALNDRSDPQYAPGDDKHIVASGRSIQSIQFTVAMLFGL